MDDVALPFEAIVFDLDGVVTQTAHLHFQAWKQTFDEYLRFKEKENFKEFTEKDYLEYVDLRLFFLLEGFKLAGESPAILLVRKRFVA